MVRTYFPRLRSTARILALAGAMVAAGAALADFVPPTPEQTRAALGSLDGESATNQRLLIPDASFEPIESPQPGDWLATHDEAGQSYDAFIAGEVQPVTDARKIIYLQPLGEFNADSAPSLEALRDYAQAFFQLDVVLLPSEVYESAAFEPRINSGTRKLQLRSTAVISWLAQRLPDDAFCLVAVTMTDLYPAPGWNFVFGQASSAHRTGVFSFARHDPLFFGEERPDDFDAVLLHRSCRTLVHEIAHIFGLEHCIYYRCIENGSNHLAESDARPQHPCPICLRKIHHATGCDLAARYRDLAYFYAQHAGWESEEAWVRLQLAKLRPPGWSPPVLAPPPREPGRFPEPGNLPAPVVPPAPTPDFPNRPAPATPPAPPDTNDTSAPPISIPTVTPESLVAQAR